MSEQLRKKLMDFIETRAGSSGKSLPDGFSDDTPLITSGLIESLHLLELALLLEEEAGSSFDLTILNFTVEWNTINDMVNFIDSYRR
jgi:acyl carrier protein